MQQKKGVPFTMNNIRASQTVNMSILLNTLPTSLDSLRLFAVCVSSVALCQLLRLTPDTCIVQELAQSAHAFRFRATFGACISYVLAFKPRIPTAQKTHSPPLQRPTA